MAQKNCFFASSSQKASPELNMLSESDKEVVSEKSISNTRIILNQEVLLLQFLVAH